MKKLIKLEFNNTTKERKTEDSYSELYSHDKNNGSFEFEILNETLTTEQVTALFKFTESNKIWKTTGTVEGNKVKVTFDTTLITQNETVICYLYFDEEQRTSDTFRFKFKVKVSEIDKMSRYEVKERFINNTVIVDRLDVVTKTELQEALNNVGGITTEGLLTEVKAEELFVKKTDAVDNTNFELVKNRVLALELKTDKDTVYDDSEVKERLTTLENKAPVDLSNYVTSEQLENKHYLTQHQPLDNLVTKEELNSKGYVTNEALNSKGYLTEEVLNSKNYLTEDVLNTKNYLTQHQDLSSLVTKQELENKHYLTEHQPLSHLVTTSDLEVLRNISVNKAEFNSFKDNVVTKTELAEKGYLTTQYDDTDVKNRIQALENRPTTGGTQTQDTGWLKVSGENAIAGNIVEIRRIGNTVHVRFRNEKNGDFIIIVENIYSILDKEISGGFGSITNNSPIFSSKNNRELGRIITNVSNNRITVESSIDIELSGSKSVYINEFSYIADDPFPTNLH